MDGLNTLASLDIDIITIALMSVRIASLFMILPIFSNTIMPALVRNPLYILIAFIAYYIHPQETHEHINEITWVMLFLKEAFIGLVIGLLFGLYLWAFDTAGKIIDGQIGLSMVQVQDPLTDASTTLVGELLSRLAIYLFIASGGLLLLFSLIFKSFVAWPIYKMLSISDIALPTLIEQAFSSYFSMAIIVSAPCIVICVFIDTSMGLVNRYAQQLNVTFLSSSIKLYVVIFIIMISVFSFNQLLIDQTIKHYNLLEKMWGL